MRFGGGGERLWAGGGLGGGAGAGVRLGGGCCMGGRRMRMRGRRSEFLNEGGREGKGGKEEELGEHYIQ